MIDQVEIVDNLRNNLWLRITIKNTTDMLNLATSIGELVPSRHKSNPLDVLAVDKQRKGRSLSSIYRDQEFPLHTDGAYLLNPPRYVLLRSLERNNCPTVLCVPKLTKDSIQDAEKDVWLVNGGHGKFYGNLIESDGSDFRIRYDLNCMRPVFSSETKSQAVFLKIISKSKLQEIHWDKNDCIIFDNWKLLHGRADARHSANRKLERIWIKN